jgi:rhodanese-related sulfurtransferase
MLSHVTMEELRKAQSGPTPPRIIDVREPAEFSRGHIRGAESIPLPALAEELKRRYPNKSYPIVLYDDLGVRSHHGARLLRSMGYRNVKEILGGYGAALPS